MTPEQLHIIQHSLGCDKYGLNDHPETNPGPEHYPYYRNHFCGGVKDEEDATHGSLDNDLELRDSLWLVEAFKFWLQAGAYGLLRAKDDDK